MGPFLGLWLEMKKKKKKKKKKGRRSKERNMGEERKEKK